jgi:hypothetical protein
LACGTCCTWLRAHTHTCRWGFTAQSFLSSSPLSDFFSGVPWVLKATDHGFLYFGVVNVHYAHIAIVFPVVLIVYYLVWKYLIGFFNQVAGIAE